MNISLPELCLQMYINHLKYCVNNSRQGTCWLQNLLPREILDMKFLFILLSLLFMFWRINSLFISVIYLLSELNECRSGFVLYICKQITIQHVHILYDLNYTVQNSTRSKFCTYTWYNIPWLSPYTKEG